MYCHLTLKTMDNKNFNRVRVEVLAQVLENYGYHEGGNSWKPKGAQMFIIYADDVQYYDKEDLVEAIKVCLEKESNDFNRFEYVNHELMFHEPIEIPNEQFDACFDAHMSNLINNNSNG